MLLARTVRDAPLEPLAVPVSFLGMYAITVLNKKGFFGGQRIEVVTRSSDNFLRPDPYTFYTIWPIIYAFSFIFTVGQLGAPDHMQKALQTKCAITGLSVRIRLCAAFIMNGLWAIANSHQKKYLTSPLMYGMLATFSSAYSDYNVLSAASVSEAVSLTFGPAMFNSWIFAASTLTVLTDVCGPLNIKNSIGTLGNLPICLSLLTGLLGVGLHRVIQGADVAWGFVVAYAARGIYRKNVLPSQFRKPEAMDKTLGNIAQVGSFLVAAAMVGKAISKVR